MSAVLNVITFELAKLETVFTVLISWGMTQSTWVDCAIVWIETPASIIRFLEYVPKHTASHSE